MVISPFFATFGYFEERKTMLTVIHSFQLTLPIEDPILKFLLILAIILVAPLLLNKLKIPYLLGLIIAGAIIGPYGLNLVLRDSSIILSGTAGLLYIMFLSGLDMDISDFKRNTTRSLVFGLYTFAIPLALGIAAGIYLLHLNLYASLLLGAIFASHTLISYPIVSKLGISRDRSVTISIGGTVIADTLSLLLLTAAAGLATGSVGEDFWWRLGLSVLLCIAVITLLFPLLAQWFFKQCSDSISQYIFVLVLVFLASYLSQLAGLEPIIGAFLAGITLSRLIPRTSSLMNRIEFVGHAIFIPFFLISVGMLIDYRAFYRDWESLKVAAVMILLILAGKYIAALLTQKSLRLNREQRTLIFGLSAAHVAASLAAVMVGYNVVLGYNEAGEPIRLLGESILNGTILMILATCTISTFATQRGAHKIALQTPQEEEKKSVQEGQLLLPIANEHSAEALVELSLMLKGRREKGGLYALNTIDNRTEAQGIEKRAQKILETAASVAAGSDRYLQTLLRYDVNISNAIVSVARERNITDILMGMHHERSAETVILGRIGTDVLSQNHATTYFYHAEQPISTIKRHLIIVPERAEAEAGFQRWMRRIHILARNTRGKVIFYASPNTMPYLRSFVQKNPTNMGFVEFEQWEDITSLKHDFREDDCLWFIMSRRERISYHPDMSHLPHYLEQEFAGYSFVLLYPMQAGQVEARYL